MNCKTVLNRSDNTRYCPTCGINWDTDEDRPACQFTSKKQSNRRKRQMSIFTGPVQTQTGGGSGKQK